MDMLSDYTKPVQNQAGHQSRLAEFLRKYWAVVIVGTICTTVSLFAYSTFKKEAHAVHIAQANDHAHHLNRGLVDSFKAYEQALIFTRGFIQSSNYVDRQEWKDFVSSAQLNEQFKGVQGFGYVQRVEPNDLDSFIKEVHDQGVNDFKIKNHTGFERADPQDPYYIVKYYEPEPKNRSALGLNTATNPANRDVYDRATDTGTVQVSVPFRLKQQAGSLESNGLVFALPHFAKGMPTTTTKDRRAAIRGWVIISLNMDHFHQAFAVLNGEEDNICMSSTDYSGNKVKLFETDIDKQTATCADCQINHAGEPIEFSQEIFGRVFDVEVSINHSDAAGELSLSEFHDNLQKAHTVLLVGIKVTLLVLFLTIFITAGRSRAQKLALRMTKSLRVSQEELRELAFQAHKANNAKSDFLASMSHEIRTPMTAILGYTEILSDIAPMHKDPDSMYKTVDRIKGAGSHLLMVINDVLDLSKIESGKLEITTAPCRIGEILTETVGTLKVRANKSNLDLQVEFQTPVPGTIITDSYRVRQILLNLVGNAIKFTDQGSVTIMVSADKDTISLAVKDSGIGIPPEQLNELFKPFVQTNSSSIVSKQGTGLGLSISRTLSEMMGGTLTATSTQGNGSTFTCTLPLKVPSDRSSEFITTLPCQSITHNKDQSQQSNQLAGRILIAEDGPDNQKLLKYFLTKAGLQVNIVENGKLAIDEFNNDPDFDLIIMDMQMPVMDGYLATKELRNAGCTLPILALTAHAMSDDRQKCINCGCDEYETKPLNNARLIRTITRLLDPERTRGQSAA